MPFIPKNLLVIAMLFLLFISCSKEPLEAPVANLQFEKKSSIADELDNSALDGLYYPEKIVKDVSYGVHPEEKFDIYLTRYYSSNGWIKEHKTRKYNGTHKDKKDFKSTRNEFKKALSICEKNNLKHLERDQLHNIARAYMAEGNYEKHDEFAFKSLEITELLSDLEPDTTWSNLANSYILQKKYDLAKKYLDLALEVLLKNQFQMGLMHVYSLFVHYHFEFSGDLKLGHEFFDKLEKIAINLEHWGHLAGTCKFLSEYYKNTKDQKKSSYYYDLTLKYIEKRNIRNKNK